MFQWKSHRQKKDFWAILWFLSRENKNSDGFPLPVSTPDPEECGGDLCPCTWLRSGIEDDGVSAHFPCLFFHRIPHVRFICPKRVACRNKQGNLFIFARHLIGCSINSDILPRHSWPSRCRPDADGICRNTSGAENPDYGQSHKTSVHEIPPFLNFANLILLRPGQATQQEKSPAVFRSSILARPERFAGGPALRGRAGRRRGRVPGRISPGRTGSRGD